MAKLGYSTPGILTDQGVNELIGKEVNTPIPPGKTDYQIIMEALITDIEDNWLSIGYGPWVEGMDPSTSTMDYANFEVISPAILSPVAAFTANQSSGKVPNDRSVQ